MSDTDPTPARFTKPALSVAEMIRLLRERGLVISDEPRAQHYLTFIGYYRLSGYFRFFQLEDPGVPPHTFQPDVDFEDVLDLYIFDRELRILVMDAIERIEVAFRSVLSDVMCAHHRDPHWYLNPRHFLPRFGHTDFLEDVEAKVDDDSSPFIKHYRENYDEPDLPPCWMIMEIMPLGTWSRVYEGLAGAADQKNIAWRFNTGVPVFRSWIQCISIIRNICAHHMRLWNRHFVVKPKSVFAGTIEIKDNPTFYAQAAVIQRLLSVIAPGSNWGHRLFETFGRHPDVDKSHMGFPAGWERNPFWGVPRQPAPPPTLPPPPPPAPPAPVPPPGAP